ncbi:MAG: aspartate dehydrogenase [Pseudomonadota bacterium]
MQQRSVAMVGFGAMGRSLEKTLRASPEGPQITDILVRPGKAQDGERPFRVVSDLDQLLAAKPKLVVECAGHEAVRDVVPEILAAGLDVVIVSVGALADPETLGRIEQATSRAGAGQARIASGAIGGLDVLRAARQAGLTQVRYTGRKPPVAWKGSTAEDRVDLDDLTDAEPFYTGTAREAARAFPKNANVAAAVALAGLGFERTEVQLIADPAAAENSHEVYATGAFGTMSITLTNAPLPDNPRTSWLAALSVAAEIRAYFAPLVV